MLQLPSAAVVVWVLVTCVADQAVCLDRGARDRSVRPQYGAVDRRRAGPDLRRHRRRRAGDRGFRDRRQVGGKGRDRSWWWIGWSPAGSGRKESGPRSPPARPRPRRRPRPTGAPSASPGQLPDLHLGSARAGPEPAGDFQASTHVSQPDPPPVRGARHAGHRSGHLAVKVDEVGPGFDLVRQEKGAQVAGHVAAARVDTGDQLLSGVAAFGEADRRRR